LAYYDDLKGSFPPGLFELLQIPGLGPKKVKALFDKLKICSVADLEKACAEGLVANLDGFGAKTQGKIVEGIKFRAQYARRHLLSTAWFLIDPILDRLRSHPDTIRCSTAGSVRRAREIVG